MEFLKYKKTKKTYGSKVARKYQEKFNGYDNFDLDTL